MDRPFRYPEEVGRMKGWKSKNEKTHNTHSSNLTSLGPFYDSTPACLSGVKTSESQEYALDHATSNDDHWLVDDYGKRLWQEILQVVST